MTDLDSESKYLAYVRVEKERSIADMSLVARRLARENSYDSRMAQRVLEIATADLLSIDKPEFFGRLTERVGTQQWYIGLRGIFSQEYEPLVIDWRTRVAEGFYQATPVEPRGLTSRRRHVFNGSEIEGYFDEDLTDPTSNSRGGLADPVLLQLAMERDGSMREVVATIQVEQDQIIRSKFDGCLIVQGGPGTGKTVVALHRLAYLLYTYRSKLTDQPVVVIGPDDRFIRYISSVLPSLGEDSVAQRSIYGFFGDAVDHQVRSDDEQFLLSDEVRVALRDSVVARISKFTEDIRIGDVHLTATSLNDLLVSSLEMNRSLSYRRQIFRKVIFHRFSARSPMDSRQTKLLESELNLTWPKITPRQLLQDASTILSDPIACRLVVAASKNLAEPQKYADAVLGRYATCLLDGPKVSYSHVLIDEAQDLSPVELATLRLYCRGGSMTLVGDIAQATRSGSTNSWAKSLEVLDFDESANPVRNLTTGYRVPEQICLLANRLRSRLGVTVPPISSVRAGEAPVVIWSEHEQCHLVVARFVGSGVFETKNLAILARPALHSDLISSLAEVGYSPVSNMGDLRQGYFVLLDFGNGKGLEFEEVVLVDPSRAAVEGVRQAREVYIGLTRAVRRVALILSSDPAHLVTESPFRETEHPGRPQVS